MPEDLCYSSCSYSEAEWLELPLRKLGYVAPCVRRPLRRFRAPKPLLDVGHLASQAGPFATLPARLSTICRMSRAVPSHLSIPDSAVC